MKLIIFVIVLFLLAYPILILFLLYHWNRIKGARSSKNREHAFSIIIPVRNEALHIKKCVDSILVNTYPKDKYEIIVINDHSTDDTAKVLKSLQYDNLRSFDLGENEEGKKSAVQKGVSLAKNDLIIQADGDTIVGEKWLHSWNILFQDDEIQIGTGPVIYSEAKGGLALFQQLEILGLMVFTGAGIASGKFYLANGANMAYRKEAFQKANLNRTDMGKASGDDVFLVQAIGLDNPGNVAFNKSNDAAVITHPIPEIKDFLDQRVRWARKTGSYKDFWLKGILAFVFFHSFFLFGLLFLAVFADPVCFWFFGLGITAKMIADWIYLKKASRYFERQHLMNHFFTGFIIQWIYIIFAGILGLIKGAYTWKGRKVS